MALTNKIDGIHRYGDNIYTSNKALCPGNQVFFNYIFQRDINGTYVAMDLALAGHHRPVFCDYEQFTFIIDGETNRAYVDDEGYDWGVKNPDMSPILTAGAAGNPNGTFVGYVTFYIRFPNGKYVETGPSEGESCTPANEKIMWTRIPTCAYNGDYLTIARRLYRSYLGVTYLVHTINDNYTTTYTDDRGNAWLQNQTVLGTTSYDIPPIYCVDMESYLQRMFVIKDNKVWWSESYQPFSFKTTSNVVVTKKEHEDLVAVRNWGDNLYLVSNEEWYRLSGSDPDTWVIKRTFSDCGICNKHTLLKTRHGMVGLWEDGIYIFDGNTNRNITDKILGKKFFTDLDDLEPCYATFDGVRYWFYYPSSGSVVDKCIILDFTYAPDIRVYHDNFVADAHEFYPTGNIHYVAKDGYEYTTGGTETIATNLITGDRAFGAITKRKCLDYLYYDIDTQGEDVTVDILVDGTSAQTLTLNTSTRERHRSENLKSVEGYRFGLQIQCADSQNVKIYSPWVLEATPVGE